MRKIHPFILCLFFALMASTAPATAEPYEGSSRLDKKISFCDREARESHPLCIEGDKEPKDVTPTLPQFCDRAARMLRPPCQIESPEEEEAPEETEEVEEVEEKDPWCDRAARFNTPRCSDGSEEEPKEEPEAAPEPPKETGYCDRDARANEPICDPDYQPIQVSNCYSAYSNVTPLSPVANGNRIYVSTSGRDSNSGSENSPLRSIQRAIDRAKAGTRIIVDSGTYNNGTSSFRVSGKNGTASAWISIEAKAGASPKIVSSGNSGFHVSGSSYISISGFTLEGVNYSRSNDWGYGILFTDSNHVAAANNTVSGFPVGGIATGHSDAIAITGNRIFGNSLWGEEQGSGISLWRNKAKGGRVQGEYRNFIVGNISYDNQNLKPGDAIGFPGGSTDGNGIILDQFRLTGYSGKTLISGNVVSRNGGKGIHVFDSNNVDVINNTSVGNSNDSDLLGSRGELSAYQASNIRFINNIAVSRNGTPILDGFTSRVSAYSNMTSGDFKFANPKAMNFQITAGSAAIDSGDSSGNSIMNFGRLGSSEVTGGAIDVGAFELASC